MAADIGAQKVLAMAYRQALPACVMCTITFGMTALPPSAMLRKMPISSCTAVLLSAELASAQDSTRRRWLPSTE